MPTPAVNAPVLHNVTIHTPGTKFVQKPKQIDIDFSKIKYEPQAPAAKKVGFFGKIGNKLKAIGTKLTKTKGGKIGLIAAGAGALLIGAAALLSKCTNDKNEQPVQGGAEEGVTPEKPETPVVTEPENPENPGVTNPDEPENPTTPGGSDPANPNIIPAFPGEKEDGNWKTVLANENFEMLCRDASGATRDIKGKLKVESDFDKNPDAFTITDTSSGEAHVYRYEKTGLDDNGKPIYKCVSMNDRETTTQNQYTLEWENETTPKLIQHENQDNYGIGLKFGKLIQKTAPEETKEEPVKDTKQENEMTEIWINRQPAINQKPKTLDDLKKDVIIACEKKRPLTETEQEKLAECKDEAQVNEYLKSIGIKLSIAY